ncbi:MAG: hypothetical protein LW875_11915 [Proteobacteria bacterium]|jgi:hypothetical protein|nr:hypothetical protein [Pseudomonadota bacterium]
MSKSQLLSASFLLCTLLSIDALSSVKCHDLYSVFPRTTLDQGKWPENPWREGFPEGLPVGKLNERLEALKTQFPEQIQFFEGIEFSFQATPYDKITPETFSGKRTVLVINRHQIDAARDAALRESVLKTLARGTISYPMGQSPGHLYSRFGTKVIDVYSSVNVGDYALNNSRIEAVVQITPREEANR